MIIVLHIYIYNTIGGFTDRNEICIAYVKLNSTHTLFMRIFLIYDIFFEIITIIT